MQIEQDEPSNKFKSTHMTLRLYRKYNRIVNTYRGFYVYK